MTRRRPHQARTANVNLLDDLGFSRTRFRYRLLKRIEIADYHLHQSNSVLGQSGGVRSRVTSEDAAMYGRVQRLYATTQYLGGACYIGHVNHIQSDIS